RKLRTLIGRPIRARARRISRTLSISRTAGTAHRQRGDGNQDNCRNPVKTHQKHDGSPSEYLRQYLRSFPKVGLLPACVNLRRFVSSLRIDDAVWEVSFSEQTSSICLTTISKQGSSQEKLLLGSET